MDNDKISNKQEDANKIENIIDINKYEDPTGVSAKNLNFGLWLSNHKHRIEKIIIIIISAVAAFFILYALYGYFYYFTLGSEHEKILNQNINDNDVANYRLNNVTKDLEILSVKALRNNKAYDLIAKIKNPNPKHYANINYCFVMGADEKCSSSFILPNEEKLIILPQQETEQPVNDITFKNNTIAWQKLNARTIPNWDIYQKDHLDLLITELKVSTYSNNLNYLEFDITNDSAYSYYEVPLNIIAKSADEIIAINRYIVLDMKNGEKRSVRLYWPESISFSGNISVIPDLDIINESIYKPYKEN